MTLIFVPIHSLIIPINNDDDTNKIKKQTQDVRIFIRYSLEISSENSDC